MMPDKFKLVPLDDSGEAVITESMVDAVFQTQEWKDIERCVKIAFQAKNFQPFTHEGWRDSPPSQLFKAMVRAFEPEAFPLPNMIAWALRGAIYVEFADNGNVRWWSPDQGAAVHRRAQGAAIQQINLASVDMK